jgi:hypothetical protein
MALFLKHPVLSTLKIEATHSSETWIITTLTWRHISEDGIFKAHPSEKTPTFVRFEVFTAVSMKNVVFWDVTPCGQ